MALHQNPKDKHFYNAAYALRSDHGKRHPVRLNKISLKSLRPVKRWNLYIRLTKTKWFKIWKLKLWPYGKKTVGYLQIRDLTFDKYGRFYFTQQTGKADRAAVSKRKYRPNRNESKRKNLIGRSVKVYQGSFSRGKVKIRIKQAISNAIGTVSQGMAYNQKNNRLFLFTIVPSCLFQ